MPMKLETFISTLVPVLGAWHPKMGEDIDSSFQTRYITSPEVAEQTHPAFVNCLTLWNGCGLVLVMMNNAIDSRPENLTQRYWLPNCYFFNSSFPLSTENCGMITPDAHVMKWPFLFFLWTLNKVLFFFFGFLRHEFAFILAVCFEIGRIGRAAFPLISLSWWYLMQDLCHENYCWTIWNMLIVGVFIEEFT